MKLHEWKLYNAEKENIGRVLTSTKNEHVASEKVHHWFGAKAWFIKMIYSGLVNV